MLVGLFAVAFADVSHLKGNYNYPKPVTAASDTVSKIAIPLTNNGGDVIGQQSAALNKQYLPSVASSNNNQVFVTSPTTGRPIIVSKPQLTVNRDYLPPFDINNIIAKPSEVHPRIETTTGRQIIISSSATPIITPSESIISSTSLPVTLVSQSSTNGYKYVTAEPSLVTITGQGSVIIPKVVEISNHGSPTPAASVIITGSPSTIATVTSGYQYVTPEQSGQGSNVVKQIVTGNSNGYNYPAGDPSLVAISGHGSNLIVSESIASPSTVVPSHSLGVDGYKYKVPKVEFNHRK